MSNWVGWKVERERESVCVGLNWTGGIRIGKGSQSKDRISKPMRTVKAKTVTVQCFAGILPKIKRGTLLVALSPFNFIICKFVFGFFGRPRIVDFYFFFKFKIDTSTSFSFFSLFQKSIYYIFDLLKRDVPLGSRTSILHNYFFGFAIEISRGVQYSIYLGLILVR